MPFSLWPSSLRSLSLAVTTATLAPASAKAASRVSARRYLGVFHSHFCAAGRIKKRVATTAVRGGGHAGDDGQVVGIGEGRHHAVSDEAAAVLEHAADEGGNTGGNGR